MTFYVSVAFVLGEEFEHLKEIFMEKHFQEFDNSEENRLCYTSIFNEYVRCWTLHICLIKS